MPTTVAEPRSICDGPVTAGAHGIYQRVAIVNVPLSGAQFDTTNIVGSLGAVDAHLTSICRSPVLQILGLFPPC